MLIIENLKNIVNYQEDTENHTKKLKCHDVK